MPTHSPSLSLDFETASAVDLRKTGAHEYARHPSTRILCLSYGFEGEPVQRWRPGEPFPERLKDHVARMRPVHGWNVGFEYAIWNHVLCRSIAQGGEGWFFPPLSLSQLRDTMAAAAYWGLPLSLDMAGEAVGLPPEFRKDKDGHKLMMQMNKPRKRYPDGRFAWWDKDEPERLDRLEAYCDQDVVVESAIAALIPPLPEDEQRVWEADQRMNERGIRIDRDLVNKLKALADYAGQHINEYLSTITGGAVPTVTSTGAMMAYLKSIGSPLEDLRKDTVSARLDDPDTPDHEREVLELRADGAKTSTAKLNAMLHASNSDGKARGALQYYGASRTGRWAGRLIQLQNMPRGTVKKIEAAIQMVLDGMSPDLIEAFFGPALGVVSSALRGCIVPGHGRRLVVADFSQIEARVVAWLAGQDDILAVFASGQDVYVYTAKKIGSDNRQLGKVLVLACGFGMSAPKFQATAGTPAYRVYLSDKQAEDAVKAWRTANDKIVQFWWECDRAAKHVIQAFHNGDANARVAVGPQGVTFAMWRGHMLVRLPSGRKLVYREARLEPDKEGRIGITYMGVDQYTRKWTRIRTYGGKLVENITQAVARDLMKDAMIEAENVPDFEGQLLVHDELIGDAPADKAKAVLDQVLAIMRKAPAWAAGLPVNAEGWEGDRYKK